MSEQDRLAEYLRKRRFDVTPEPAPGRPRPRKGSMFVIQHHMARREHYDLRLEVEGVLASWAVPKGPSYDPAKKRLAMRTEDHPMSYAAFEGTIPKGEYGGGTVMVWDAGIYRNDTERRGRPVPMARAIRNGEVKFWLEGAKLRGGWVLVRIQDAPRREAWLLIKHRDATAGTPSPPGVSILTGRTMEEIRRAG